MTEEINRGRPERREVWAIDVAAETVGFPGAAQVARLEQCRGQGETESVFLISSLEAGRLDAAGLLQGKRAYWAIENGLHQRLDGTRLDEDRSRVRTPNSALVLAMMRRMAVSLANAWIARQSDARRATTSGFIDVMRLGNNRAAFALASARRPQLPS